MGHGGVCVWIVRVQHAAHAPVVLGFAPKIADRDSKTCDVAMIVVCPSGLLAKEHTEVISNFQLNSYTVADLETASITLDWPHKD